MENFDNENRSTTNNKRLVLGLLFLFFGVMVIMKHTGIFPVDIMHFIFSWEMILIGIGVLGLVFGRHVSTNLILILIGAFFIMGDIYHFPFELKKLIIPFILIFIGLMMLFQKKRLDHPHFKSRFRTGTNSNDYIDEVSIFGGGKINVTSENFKGGNITAIFGGSEINLLNSKLAPGDNVINAFYVFGGTNIIAPADWTIKIDLVSVFGGFSDKRSDYPTTSQENNKTLYIKGLAVFGGGEIKNF